MAELTEEQKKYNDELLALLKKTCKELYPHFESVMIFATKHESNEIGTTYMDYKMGNFFTNYGQIALWLKNQKLESAEENNE